MAKKILFIVDPLESLDIQSDTSLALMEEFQCRGSSLYACQIGDIFLNDGLAHFLAAPVLVEKNYRAAPLYSSPKEVYGADHFDAIFMRKDPPVDEKFIAALLMLRCHNKKKTKIFNDPDALLMANEKLFGLDIAHEFFPKTIVSSNKSLLRQFIDYHKKIVLKPLYGMGGSGVMVFDHQDNNISSALELLSNNFTMPVMAQAFIKNARQGDKRIIVLGGKAVGAILRVPQSQDHRANFHAGGIAVVADISDREHEIVKKIAPHLKRLGLHLVGIDVIDGHLTEINVTSPTCVIEIEKYSQKGGQKPLRAQIVDYFLEVLA